MNSVSDHSKKNILVLPQSLYTMTDVVPLLHTANTGIFYKSLRHDLVDVEFYTNTPCLVYIESGQETITTSENKTHELHAGSAVFLPQGLNVHSDYVRTTSSLKAYLTFFDEDVISEFLSTYKVNKSQPSKIVSATSLLNIQCDDLVKTYFDSIQKLHKRTCNTAPLLKVKLLELLYLLAIYDKAIYQTLVQSKHTTHPPKRNITRLLNNPNTLKLTIKDLANLSGKSVSTFTRDFKSLYSVTPNQWLQEKRLVRAYQLLQETELTVTHIAADLGYENVSHFIKLFKKKYSITPKQFKQSN